MHSTGYARKCSPLCVCNVPHTEPHSKALNFFQTHNQVTSLDASKLDLTADSCAAFFKALGSHCHSLSSLSLKGSQQLGDAAMAELASSLSHVSTLSELNLSRTGITAQVMVPQCVCACLCGSTVYSQECMHCSVYMINKRVDYIW